MGLGVSVVVGTLCIGVGVGAVQGVGVNKVALLLVVVLG